MARRLAFILHEMGSSWRALIRDAGVWDSSFDYGVEKASGQVGTWEAGVVTQARDDAGSAQGGSFGERERSGWIGVGGEGWEIPRFLA